MNYVRAGVDWLKIHAKSYEPLPSNWILAVALSNNKGCKVIVVIFIRFFFFALFQWKFP